MEGIRVDVPINIMSHYPSGYVAIGRKVGHLTSISCQKLPYIAIVGECDRPPTESPTHQCT